MWGGALSLIAKIGVPLVASAIQSITQPKPQPQVAQIEQPSVEQQLASRFDVSKMSVNEMQQLADNLYNSGKITLEEYGILTSMPMTVAGNDAGGVELVAYNGSNDSQQRDFIKNLEQSIQARLDNGIRQGTDASISLLNKLKTLKAMHHQPLTTSA